MNVNVFYSNNIAKRPPLVLTDCDFCGKELRGEKGEEDWFRHKNSPYILCWECYNRRLAERKMAKFKKSRINTPRSRQKM